MRSNANNTHVQDNDSHSLDATSKPEVLKGWPAKLLVLGLCLISFYAGWMANQNHSSNLCLQAGGQVLITNDTRLCKLN